MRWIEDIFLLGGFAGLVTGIGLIDVRAALVLGGALLMLLGLAMGRQEQTDRKK